MTERILTPRSRWDFDERWISPHGAVPVDMQTTTALLTEVKRLRALLSEIAYGRVRDWPEDFDGENGNYTCTCHACGREFIGHKRRVTCKLCAPSAIGRRFVVCEPHGFAGLEFCPHCDQEAQRYRWWRSKWIGPDGEFDVLNDYLSACESAEQCDAAIDAGMKEKP